MKELVRIFKGLADGNRLRILHLLFHGELCVCDIQHVLASPQPNVSRHLTYLKHCGLVLDRREGFRVYYRLADACQKESQLLFDFLRESWKEDEQMRTDLVGLKRAIRDGHCTVSAFVPYSALRAGKAAPHAGR